MEHIDYFKLQSKNLLKDYKTRFSYRSEMREQVLYDYKPKYFDIRQIFIDFDFPHYKEDFSFSLMNAQHIIAKIAGFESWSNLKNADDEEQRLAHHRFDLSKYKLVSPFAGLHTDKSEKTSYEASDFYNTAVLVREKSHALGFGEPVYRPAAHQGFDAENFNNLYEIPLKPPMGFTAKNPKTGLYDFSVKIGIHFFAGSGANLLQAKFAADKKAYQFLCYEEQKRKSSTDFPDSPVEESEEWGIPVRYSGLMAIKEYREKWGIK